MPPATNPPPDQSRALMKILSHPSTIKFRDGSDNIDFAGINLLKNPQKTPTGAFVWLLDDRSEASVTAVGKVIYGTIGDKTGPYLSLPDASRMPEVTAEEMAKAKVGFALRFLNRELVVDALVPEELTDHNQASLEWFFAMQERADERLAQDKSGVTDPRLKVMPFLKAEEGNPFYILPVVSEPLFPQFKGPRTPGVIRTRPQHGRISLNPSKLSSEDKSNSPPEQVHFRDLPDPKSRFAALKANQAYQRYEMCIPPVFTIDGKFVLPWKYEEVIPDGTLVAVRGKMKMYNITNQEKSFTNRPYLFAFDRLQVVGDGMIGWDEGNKASLALASKKRHFEMSSPSHPAFKRRNTSDEDIEL